MTFDGKREFYQVTKISPYLPFTSNYFYKKVVSRQFFLNNN